MKVITKIILILSLLFTLSCGFKIIDESNVNNFKIIEVSTKGNNRINYKIKNRLLSNNNRENIENILSINIKTESIKKIKEKNIKNEVTKYELTLNGNIETYLIEKNITNS